jgi:transglutaminase-like putative cysteine protease
VRLRIEHTAVYTYDTPVLSSYNEARLLPQTEERQLTLEAVVRTEPPAPQQRHWDYWGTQVVSFDLHQPHEKLTVVGRSVVETLPAAPRPDASISWAELDDDTIKDAFVETLGVTRMTTPVPELVEVASTLRAGAADPTDFVHAVIGWVKDSLQYRPGSTGVNTTAAEAWTAGVGVCQDHAHLALLLLRSAGVPARYVSGYLHPWPDAAIGDVVHGESHAWLEAWLGRWVPADPTNGAAVGPEHVVVARGREYGDVPPLRGLYSGSAGSSLEVSVSVQRLR